MENSGSKVSRHVAIVEEVYRFEELHDLHSYVKDCK